MLPRKIDSFKDIADLYDLFIFDIYGVIHNGEKLNHATVDFINYLRSINKQIAILSNNPRPSEVSVESLKAKGLELLNHEKIVTSGDYFRFCFEHDDDDMFAGRTIFNLGAELNPDLLSGLNVDYADSIEDADYMLISTFIDDETKLDDISQHLETALNYQTQVICVNPDVTAPQGDHTRYTPGYFAKKYLAMGGSVYYYGKPHAPIYDYLFYDVLDVDPNESKAIMIGDSVGTDILGATNFGIDSLLLTSGVHADLKHEDVALQQVYQEFDAYPTFVMNEPKF